MNSWPTFENRRPEISGMGILMGAVHSSADRRMIVHSATYDHADSIREFISICKSLGFLDESFLLSSIQFLSQAVFVHAVSHRSISIFLLDRK